jgi:U4/U6.U5 tri-snRNP-associated protein 1
VAHDLDDIGLAAGGEGRILTLRDGRILDGDEDELMDSAISQQERDRANAERKRGAKGYTGLDDEEFDNAPGSKRSVLSKYDAALGPDDVPPKAGDGGFRIGAEPLEDRRAREEEQKAEAARMLNRTVLSLDYKSECAARAAVRRSLLMSCASTENGEVSDYLQEGDVGFKRPKVSQRLSCRARVEQD